MISLKHKFIFLHPVKTGGTSISVALLPFCDNKSILETMKPVPVVVGDEKDNYWFPWYPDPNNTLHIAKHAALQEYYNYFREEELKTFKIFCAIRNPFDRVVSFTNWHYKPESFTEPILEKHIKLVQRMLSMFTIIKPDGTTEIWPTKFIRFESMQEDFDQMCKDVGIETSKLPHKNKTGHHPYRTYYENYPNLIPKVEAVLKDDLEYFNYAY